MPEIVDIYSLPPGEQLEALMKYFMFDETEAREILAIHRGESDGDVVIKRKKGKHAIKPASDYKV